MVLLQYQNISIFKELIKPKIIFGFFIRYIYSINRHAAANFLTFKSTLDQITTSKIVDILLHFIKLKSTITRTKTWRKITLPYFSAPISIIEKIIQKKKVRIADVTYG
jgi:hypothetical protein